MTFYEASQMTEEEARAYLEKIRWPDGVVCPHCGSMGKMYKLNGDAHRPGVYKCSDCRKQFSVTVNTVMHRSKIPLRKWVMAFHLICGSKKGIPALALQRHLDLGSYRTAWHMAHRIRMAMREHPMVDLLDGVVEADETYIGGRRKGSRPGRSTDHKTPVFALIQRDGDARVQVVANVTGKTLKGAIREQVSPSATIMTDEYGSYRGLGMEFSGGHYTVSHMAKEYARDGVHVNTCESFFALLKRGVTGSFHSVSREHLGRYCDEFSFRWNRRELTDGARTAEAIRGADGKRLTYRTPASH